MAKVKLSDCRFLGEVLMKVDGVGDGVGVIIGFSVGFSEAHI